MNLIAIGGIMHESNTFCNIPTDYKAFSITVGEEIYSSWTDTHHEMAGFIHGRTIHDYATYPTIMAAATPAGPVTDDAFELLYDRLMQSINENPRIDGLLLALHGAMVVESYPDGDGEVLRRLRDYFPQKFPIVVTLDYHANVSQLMVDKSTALVIYKTNPHIDQKQRGIQAAKLIMQIIRQEVIPTQTLAKPPMLLDILHQNTNTEPMLSIVEETKNLEEDSNILVANVAAGYPYADVYEVGPSFVVVTDNDMHLAQTEANRLSNRLWNIREQLSINLPDAAAAVKQAIQSKNHPVILVEMGDNIGGGSPGDSTVILSELVQQNASNYVVVLYDPDCVQACIQKGINHEITLQIGGKTDNLHGEPVKIDGKIRSIHDGKFIETEARHGGQRYHDQGLTVVISVSDSYPTYVVLTSKRQTPFSLQQLLSLGIDPKSMQIIVVKAAIAYRAAYEPIAGEIIEVDTPGITAVNPQHFSYQHIRKELVHIG